MCCTEFTYVLVWFREIRVVPGTPDGFEAGWDATGVNRCTRVRIVFHSACTSTRQDQDSARVSAHVSVPVGHFIGDGPGACPVASIGLRSFRVYRGVSGPLTILGVPGTPWSADRPGQVFVVSAHWHSSSYCVARGARGHNILPKPKLPQITFLDLGNPLPYASLRDSSA